MELHHLLPGGWVVICLAPALAACAPEAGPLPFATMPTEVDLCGVRVEARPGLVVVHAAADQDARVTWAHDGPGGGAALGAILLPAEAPAPAPLLGFPHGAGALVEVETADCAAHAALALPARPTPALPTLAVTRGDLRGLEDLVWLLPALTTRGAGLGLVNAWGDVVWELPLAPTGDVVPGMAPEERMAAYPRVRRARIADGALRWMDEARAVGEGCRFLSWPLVAAADEVPAVLEVPADCHHDWTQSAEGELVFPAFEDRTLADVERLVDDIVAVDPQGAATSTLARLGELLDIAPEDLDLVQDYDPEAPNPDQSNVSYVNGGAHLVRADGSAEWWIVNVADAGLLRIARDGDGAVTGLDLLSDDPTRSDFVVEAPGDPTPLFSSPHGLGCEALDDGTERCFVHNRGFEYATRVVFDACTSVSALDVDPAGHRVLRRWRAEILGPDGACLPSLVHGNTTVEAPGGTPLVSTLATSTLPYGAGEDGTPPIAIAVHEADGRLRLQLEPDPADVAELVVVGFLSGPWRLSDLAAGALPPPE